MMTIADVVDNQGKFNLNELARQCFELAQEKGWNEKQIPVPEMCALIHSEVSEALESWRNKEEISWTQRKAPIAGQPPQLGKPMGLASEFADVLIRIGHYAVRLGIDLDHEVKRKLEYNKTRPYRHGGKRV